MYAGPGSQQPEPQTCCTAAGVAIPQASAGTAGPATAGPIMPCGCHPFHPNIKVTRGVLEAECKQLMVNLFKQRRQEQKANKDTRTAARAACAVALVLADTLCRVAAVKPSGSNLEDKQEAPSPIGAPLNVAISAVLAVLLLPDLRLMGLRRADGDPTTLSSSASCG